jgi:hypothetical protein
MSASNAGKAVTAGNEWEAVGFRDMLQRIEGGDMLTKGE